MSSQSQQEYEFSSSGFPSFRGGYSYPVKFPDNKPEDTGKFYALPGKNMIFLPGKGFNLVVDSRSKVIIGSADGIDDNGNPINFRSQITQKQADNISKRTNEITIPKYLIIKDEEKKEDVVKMKDEEKKEVKEDNVVEMKDDNTSQYDQYAEEFRKRNSVLNMDPSTNNDRITADMTSYPGKLSIPIGDFNFIVDHQTRQVEGTCLKLDREGKFVNPISSITHDQAKLIPSKLFVDPKIINFGSVPWKYMIRSIPTSTEYLEFAKVHYRECLPGLSAIHPQLLLENQEGNNVSLVEKRLEYILSLAEKNSKLTYDSKPSEGIDAMRSVHKGKIFVPFKHVNLIVKMNDKTNSGRVIGTCDGLSMTDDFINPVANITSEQMKSIPSHLAVKSEIIDRKDIVRLTF